MLGFMFAVRLLRTKSEGLFAKLNSGATNSIGGTSRRSVALCYSHHITTSSYTVIVTCDVTLMM